MALFSQTTATTARIADGSLVLSMLDATSPVVWRMDLKQATSSALEVRPAEGGLFALVLRTPRGDVHEVARYVDQLRAMSALAKVTRALRMGRREWWMDAVLIVLGVVLSAGMGWLYHTETLRLTHSVSAVYHQQTGGAPVPAASTPQAGPSESAAPAAAAEAPAGKPVSADDFLKRR